MTDSELRELLKRSPNDGHQELFHEYFPYVYTIVFRKLQNVASMEDVEECVSDVFAEIFRHYDTHSEYDGDLKGYISTIANRKAVDMFRILSRNQGNTISMDEIGEMDSGIDIVQNAEQSAQNRMVLQAVKDLGEPDTTIILQRYYFGYSSREIAKNLNLSAVAVRMRCSRALKQLRKKLEQSGITMEV
ncbi:MAG TPA: RNA polymerase subunit sigma-24 [Ruminococcus sp.]|nr:RNA polymerase subunit sigma-24 [Ruminococcus sp.]